MYRSVEKYNTNHSYINHIMKYIVELWVCLAAVLWHGLAQSNL